jgi:hypothetical protein
LDDWENELEEFLILIRDHYQDYPNDKISEKIKDLSPKEYYTIYVILSPETKELEFHDDITFLSKIKKKEHPSNKTRIEKSSNINRKTGPTST